MCKHCKRINNESELAFFIKENHNINKIKILALIKLIKYDFIFIIFLIFLIVLNIGL